MVDIVIIIFQTITLFMMIMHLKNHMELRKRLHDLEMEKQEFSRRQ